MGDAFKDRDRIDWAAFVPGDLVAVDMRPVSVFEFKEGSWDAKRVVQGVYIGCEVVGRDRFLRVLGTGGLVTSVDTKHVQDLRVVARLSDCMDSASEDP